MVSRTRIPTGMRSSSYTPSTPSGTVTPEVMTKSGSGEPHSKEIIQDYPCGDETGHYFISSPLNVYSIGRSGSVVLYVEGGCPNFTWASDNAWATFSSATTSTRYNTISSTSAEGQDTVVTVTDTNGLEVTISVPWNGAATCCEDVPLALATQTPVDEITGWPTEIVLFIDGGCPAFDWTISGSGFTLDYAATNSRRNRVYGAIGAYGMVISVEDLCEALICWSPDFSISAPCGFVETGETLAVAAVHGHVPIDWEWVGSHVGWTLAEAQSADLDVDVTVVSGPTDRSATLKATDLCGSTSTVTLSVDDSVEFDGDYGRHPFVIKTSDGIVAISYEGPNAGNYDGYTKTYSIDSHAQLTYVDVLEHRNASATHHKSCMRSGGVLCTSYVETGGDLGISAIVVDGSGNMSQHANSYLQYYPSGGVGSWHALFARSETSGGIIISIHDAGGDKTYAVSMNVADDGEVTDPIIERLQLTANGDYPHGAMVVSDEAFLAVWQDGEFKLSGRTVGVGASGSMATISDETQFTTFAVADFQVLKVKEGWALVLCRDANNAGYIVAIQISSGGAITIPDDSVYKFTDDDLGAGPAGYILDEHHVAIVTYDNQFGMHFWLFEMQLDSGVSWTQLEHYDYGADHRQSWSVDKIRDNILAIGYLDDDNDGWIRTKRVCY